MITVQIDIPAALEPFTRSDNEHDRLVRNAMIIFPFIQNETVSYGRAAEILNVRKIDLITLYGNLGLPYFNQSKEDLAEDLRNIRTVLENAK